MTRGGIEELVKTWRGRYVRASREQKTQILDEFVALTGYHRKSAIRLLVNGHKPKSRDRRGRPSVYTNEVKAALITVWGVCGKICSKRLVPFLPEIVDALERHGELRLTEETRHLLLKLSPATMDRLLTTHRKRHGRGRCTTKPGTLLRQSIPIRTFTEWDDAVPGFLELDLVAHCGETVAGEYLNTLNGVDIVTAWCEPVALANRSQHAVQQAINTLRRRLPFPLWGLDVDNDGMFINHNLARYCEKEKITFTRCRPYKKNDQAHIEQKNWTAVRQVVGYDRYESEEALALLGAVYEDLRLYLNFFQPVRKVVSKERTGSKVHKTFDRSRTPYRRVLSRPEVSDEVKATLQETFVLLNPVALRKRIDDNLRQLWRLPR